MKKLFFIILFSFSFFMLVGQETPSFKLQDFFTGHFEITKDSHSIFTKLIVINNKTIELSNSQVIQKSFYSIGDNFIVIDSFGYYYSIKITDNVPTITLLPAFENGYKIILKRISY